MSTCSAKRQPEKPQVWNFVEPKEQKLLGFSGKIGAGKTSCSNFLHSLTLVHLIQKTPHARVSPEGKLIVLDMDNTEKEISVKPHSKEAAKWLSEEIWPFIRNISIADPLKEFCINFLGLPRELAYGDQKEKNYLCGLQWEDQPFCPEDKTGEMTARECLEHWGSGIIRKINPRAHVNAFLAQVDSCNSAYVVCDDVRYANEVEAIESRGGHVIRLTLTTDEAAQNQHESNLELDNYSFKYVIDNQNLSMEQTFSKLVEILIELGWFAVIG